MIEKSHLIVANSRESSSSDRVKVSSQSSASGTASSVATASSETSNGPISRRNVTPLRLRRLEESIRSSLLSLSSSSSFPTTPIKDNNNNQPPPGGRVPGNEVLWPSPYSSPTASPAPQPPVASNRSGYDEIVRLKPGSHTIVRQNHRQPSSNAHQQLSEPMLYLNQQHLENQLEENRYLEPTTLGPSTALLAVANNNNNNNNNNSSSSHPAATATINHNQEQQDQHHKQHHHLYQLAANEHRDHLETTANLLLLVGPNEDNKQRQQREEKLDSSRPANQFETIIYLMSNLFRGFDHSLPIALILGLIILITFVGNVLVCLSVIKVRKLRNPANYLLISLAISDLCVACVVMPFGLYQSINDKWQLGRLLCNVYVVSDVTSCTASILNLCVISIDRYLAITRPLTYCAKRTTRLMMILIAFVWICACLISVPPLLISGNEYGTPEEPRCEVSQSLWYQLYATCISFYIPLIVMICLYYNIYTAAKRVVEAELRATTGLHVNQQQSNHNNDSVRDADTNNPNTGSIALNNPVNHEFKPNPIGPPQALTGTAPPISNSSIAIATTTTTTSRTNSVMRERKASITLGVIMSAFTICWLPFFIIALLRPFSETFNNLPRTFVLLTLWLGYANSLLNPIIYVTFHHDFRNAFKHLLCLRCMTINEHIRKDEYRYQFGETHYQENIRKMRNQQQLQQQQLLSKKVAQLP